MPWCPQCDETFPEGPACPRCSTPLVDVADIGAGAETQAGGTLPQLKVPRRLRRAFDRLNRPPAPPRQLMGFTLLLLVFAGGVLLGRAGGVPGEGPAVRTLLGEGRLTAENDGSLGYIARMDGMSRREPALVRHDVSSGTIEPVSRFTLPFASTGRERTLLRSLGGSVALVISDGSRSQVAAFPVDRPPFSWVDGLEAVWESPDSLFVLESEGHLVRWVFGRARTRLPVDGPWIDIRQTPGGAALEGVRDGARFLAVGAASGITETVAVPAGSRVLAVSSSGRSAVVEEISTGVLSLWDGAQTIRLRDVDGFRPIGAAFSADNGKVAVTMHHADERAEVYLALAGMDGGVSIRRLTNSARGEACDPAPAWDPAGRWVYVVPGDGHIYQAEVGGGRVVRAKPNIVGCGLAWSG